MLQQGTGKVGTGKDGTGKQRMGQGGGDPGHPASAGTGSAVRAGARDLGPLLHL